MNKYKVETNTFFNKGSNRTFAGLPFQKYEVKQKADFFHFIKFLYLKFSRKGNLLPLFEGLHFDLGQTNCDIRHFFNTISLSNTPWVTTFETILPDYFYCTNLGVKKGIERLAHKSCKKLIAFSQCTYDIECEYLNDFPDYKEKIERKMCIIHPAQPMLINGYAEKELNNEYITFSIVGHDFFRKGGKEIIKVFDYLLQKNDSIRLNIISRLKTDDVASQATENDLMEVKKIIERHPHNISYYEALPYHETLKVLKRTNVGLLPSYFDTYGFSVLENQASGCPVISTNVRALPEINNSEIGWVIDVPKDKWGNASLCTNQAREQVSKTIFEGLLKIIEDIMSNPHCIREKGNKALERIKISHNSEVIMQRIEAIYDEILANEPSESTKSNFC